MTWRHERWHSLSLLLPAMVLISFLGGMAISWFSAVAEHQTQVLTRHHEDIQRNISHLSSLAQRWMQIAPQMLEEDITAQSTDPRVQVAAIINTEGHILYATRRDLLGKTAAHALPGLTPGRLTQAANSRTSIVEQNATGDQLIAMMSYATPARAGELRSLNRGVVYLAYDLSAARAEMKVDLLNERWPELLTLLLAGLLLAALLNRVVAHPLSILESAALDMARGKFDSPLNVKGPKEIRGLNQAFLAMRAQLAETIDRLDRDSRRTQAILDNVVDGIITIDQRDLILSFNQAAERMFGYDTASVLGQNIKMLMPEPYRSHHDGYLASYQQTGQPRVIGIDRELLGERKDGSTFPIALMISEIRHENQTIYIGRISDISARKQAEAAQARHNRMLGTIASATEALMREQSEAELMTRICRILVDQGGFRMAWIGLIDPDGVRIRPVAEYGFDEAYLAHVDIHCDDSPQGQGPTGCAIRQGTTVINDDTETNERFAPWRERARAQGYRSSAATPLRVRGQVIGAVNVYSAETHAFGTDELAEIEKLTADLGYALERRQAEQAAHQAQQRLSNILKVSPVGIYETDAQGQCIFVNAQWCEIAHLTADQAMGQGWVEGLHPDDRPKVFAEWNAAIRENRPFTLEYRFGGPDKKITWVLGLAVASRDQQGQITGFIGTLTDITDVRTAEEALRESEARFKRALQGANDGLWDWNIQTGEAYYSPRWLSMLGYLEDELESNVSTWERLVHPDDLPQARERIQAFFEDNQHHLEIEFRMRHKANYWVHILGRGYLERDETGQPLRLTGTHVDITQRKQAEAALRRYQETLEVRVEQRTSELKALNQELEAFSYSVSHDLRAPLRAVDGFSQALLEDCAAQLDETGRDYLQRIRSGAQHMGQLIDDLLKLSRVTRVPLLPESVDLTRMAREIARQLRDGEPGRDIRIDIADHLSCEGDPGLLRIVLENLLGNAWKYTSKSAAPHISFDAVQQGDETVFRLRDNGVGFDMAYAGKLFGAFQRLHHKRDFEGTGIGLATVARIVRRHHGRVWTEAEPGKGAVFYFTITAPDAGSIDHSAD